MTDRERDEIRSYLFRVATTLTVCLVLQTAFMGRMVFVLESRVNQHDREIERNRAMSDKNLERIIKMRNGDRVP